MTAKKWSRLAKRDTSRTSPITVAAMTGPTKGLDVDRHFYWPATRHEGSVLAEVMTPLGLTFYICGWSLARAHARSGDPVAIAEYLGGSDAFDRSSTDFSQRYADQNEKDYQQFVTASGPGARSPRRRLSSDAHTSGLAVNAWFFALAATAALHPKLLALDLLLIENRRRRARCIAVAVRGGHVPGCDHPLPRRARPGIA